MDTQINPKLRHLSEEQIQTLITRYYNQEKISTLLHEYQIDCPPNNLIRLFPPVILGDEHCCYCGTPMHRHWVSRGYSKHSDQNISCPSCGHRQDNKNGCRCNNCREERKREELRLQESYERAIRSFCQSNWPPPTSQQDVATLDLKTAVAFLALVRTCLFVDHTNSDQATHTSLTLEALARTTIPFAPMGPLGADLLNILLIEGLIGISESSPVDAFEFENGKLADYYPSRVRWNITAQDPERLLAEITDIADERCKWPANWTQQVKDLWLEIALEECKEFFRYTARERGLPNASEKSNETMLKNLLKDFSVAQCYRIIWGGAQQASDFLVRKRCSKQHAANYSVGCCQRWSDRARAEDWEVKHFKRNFNLPRSALSHTFFDLFLKIGEDGFNLVPSDI